MRITQRQAKKEGYEQIAGMFQQASEYNKEHARVWFKLLNDGIGDTKENVRRAVQTERPAMDRAVFGIC